MVESIVRLVVAGGLLAYGLMNRGQAGSPALQGAAWVFIWAGTAFLLDHKGLMKKGWAGIVAAVDAVTVGYALAACHQSDQLGFLVLAPVLWGARTFAVDAVNVAPIAALSLFATPFLFKSNTFTPLSMINALAVLAVGLMTPKPRLLLLGRDQEAKKTVDPKSLAVVKEAEEIRENYRLLREHAVDQEARGKRDRVAMHLHEALAIGRETPFPSLAKAFSEIAGTASASLFTLGEASRRLNFTSAFGDVPEELVTTRFDIPRQEGEEKLKKQIEAKLLEWESHDGSTFAGVLLRSCGKVCGLVVLSDPNETQLAVAQNTIEEISDVAGNLVSVTREREDQRRRLMEAETLYHVAAVSLGAESRSSVAGRVVREVAGILKLDHVSVVLVEGQQPVVLASEGVKLDIVDDMSFAYGPGVAGWLGTNSPEVVIEDAYSDDRVSKDAAVRKRIGSLAMVPVAYGDEPYGYILASTHRIAGIDTPTIETLRTLAAELSQSFARLENDRRDPEGLMTPVEFRGNFAKSQGSFVHLDVLRKSEIVEAYGQPAVDLAFRRFATKARARLPQGGGLCRRDEGDYVVFLPAMNDEAARRWANDLISTASMTVVTTPDGRQRIPFAIRAKVANVSKKMPAAA